MLKKQDILDKTNGGLEVFRYYLRGDWQVGKNFKNLLYDDKNASCNIYKDEKHNCYKMKDFGNEMFGGDCFFLVGFLHHLDCKKNIRFCRNFKDNQSRFGSGFGRKNEFFKGYTP